MAARYYNRGSRQKGDLSKLRAKLWRVIEALEKAMEEAQDVESLSRASYAFVNACREYRGLFETTEFEAAIKDIEERLSKEQPAKGIKT